MSQFFLCYVETTRRCNLACPYCMSRLNGPSARRELTTEELATNVLDELAIARPGAAVAFSGGEMLLRPDALELVRHAGEKGLKVFLNTNGVLLSERPQLIERLQEASEGNFIVVLPFNSVDEEPQRWTRNDSAKTVMRLAEICESKGVSYFFLVTISCKTAGSIGKTMQYLKRRQIPVLRAPFVPRGAGNAFRDLMLTREIMEREVHPALSANPLSYISFTPFFASPEALEAAWRENGLTIAGLGCQAGRSFAAVSAEGDIAPCVQLLDSGAVRGNVLERRLSDVLDSDPVFLMLRSREQLDGKCGRCRYKMSCGGCRAMAYYTHGNIMGEDPTCFFEPRDARDRSPLEEMQTRNTKEFLDFVKYNEPWNELFGS